MASIFACNHKTAQSIEGLKTDTFKVLGNCEMCEKRIETAAKSAGAAQADWNVDTKMLSVAYDTAKTDKGKIQAAIVSVGHDVEGMTADKAVYDDLPGCCQYDRAGKAEAAGTGHNAMKETHAQHGNHETVPAKKEEPTAPAAVVEQDANPLSEVYAAYFTLKDALVKTDGKTAAAAAKTLYNNMVGVKMEALQTAQHTVWMKYLKKLSSDAEKIKGSTDIESQREHFASLSLNMYEVMKTIKPETEVYYDHCPMYKDGKGANWLSKEKAIKNPYYGSQMMTCGKLTETLK